MDQAIRNTLRNVVTKCRKLLEEAISQELQGRFGIFQNTKHQTQNTITVEDEGRMKNLSKEDKGYRRDIIAHLEHIQALGYKAKDALAQLVREIAFTHLNRLCAYKMMEAREVWVGGQRFREAVSRGMKSQGFQFYLADHADDKKLFDAGHQDVAYRHFLGWLGALLSEEIGVLFSSTDPANRLFPPQRVLDDVLALLNSDDLKDIWAEDETIGWVYQYFTPKELRDQVRKESAAPRNSYELAFRNQFFTPRYVVEFLTDNTLGRIWYEMRKGDTKLKDQCRYMVRRPSEVFLAEGQSPPEPTQDQEELSQEELLKQLVHIPHRPKKDPRELRILDPACGSGHFLLYCFALLLTIYEEAYADPDVGPMLKEDYPTLDALRRDVPRLILAHNLHGIDIDLRATQIAALALWLRCQRAYREMGLRQERPRITRSNFVCAEPMPGEKEMLDEFLKTLKQDRLETLIRRVMQVSEGSRIRATQSMVESLTELVRLVWDRMQLAGEAGSLLRIEEELEEAVRKGQEEWEEKQPLFRFTEFSLTEKPKESYVRYIPGEEVSFWQRAEALVLEALRDYARHAANGGRLQRQLFADDAERGFAFIDICQKQFDVVLMNPPFGEGTSLSQAYLSGLGSVSANDLYAAFVERGVGLLEDGGAIGAITSRTGFFLPTFRQWREAVLLRDARPVVFADLGPGVLDTAMVETAAYCLSSAPPSSAVYFRLIQSGDKNAELMEAARSVASGCSQSVFVCDPTVFTDVPEKPFCYWIAPSILSFFRRLPRFDKQAQTRRGMATLDDFRFLRLATEVPQVQGASSRYWVPYAKGESSGRFYESVVNVVLWKDDGKEVKQYVEAKVGSASRTVQSESLYFRAGLTWVRRTHRLCVRVHAKGGIFSGGAQGIFCNGKDDDLLSILGVLSSRIFDGLTKLGVGRTGDAVQFEPGMIARVPTPLLSEHQGSADKLREYTRRAWVIKWKTDRTSELSPRFEKPALAFAQGKSLADSCLKWQHQVSERLADLQFIEHEIDRTVAQMYQVGDDCGSVIGSLFPDEVKADTETTPTTSGKNEGSDDLDVSVSSIGLVSSLLSWCGGVVFGRFDFKAWGLIEESEPPQPFDPLPSVAPGIMRCVAPAKNDESVPRFKADQDGIIPDDPDHFNDIVRRVREVLELIWKDRAEAIEKEACDILGVKELRDYFRKPGKGGFWDDHVSRYSKSRRKAPIYWLLQSSKKNYALWLYYHRLDKDMLFKARQNYVEPKIRLEQTRLDSLRSSVSCLVSGVSQEPKHQTQNTKHKKQVAKDIERQEALLVELKDFAEKLERAAKLNFGNPEKLNSEVVYDPDLNDGVVLTIAPLWELVPWKEAKSYWEELLEGKYEWSSMGKLLRKKGLVK